MLELTGVALELQMVLILAGAARLDGKSEDIAPFGTADGLNSFTNFSSPGSACVIQGFFVACCKKSWSLKTLAHLQITTDQYIFENPRPTGRWGAVADGG